MTYQVRTPVYEGPLDLLLTLITSRQLAVTEVRLTDLVTDYLAHLELMRSLDLDVTSEFLLVAATLIQLKARSLLPGEAAVDLDEDLRLAEERDRLLARLLANLTFKDVAAVLAMRLEAGERFVARTAGPEPGLGPPPGTVRVGATPADLARVAGRVLAGSGEPDLDHLELDLPSVSDAIRDLRRRIEAELETDFDRVTAHLAGPLHMVAYFLALLELARWGLVEARQRDEAAAITLRHTAAPGAAALVSEWDP